MKNINIITFWFFLFCFGLFFGSVFEQSRTTSISKNKSVKEIIGLYLDKEISNNKQWYDKFKEDEENGVSQKIQVEKYEYHLKQLLELKDKIKEL